MSVICSAPGAAPAASSGIQTRSGAAPKAASSNILLVKGAAECLLGRSTHVSAHAPPAQLASVLTCCRAMVLQGTPCRITGVGKGLNEAPFLVHFTR